MKQENNMSNVLSNMTEDEVNKLSVILAAMQKISETEQIKVLPKEDIAVKSKVIIDQLPEKPANILLRIIRDKQESKLQKAKENITALKNKVGKRTRQNKKFERKIKKFKAEIEKFKSANNFLDGLNGDSGIKDFLISKNENQIAKLEQRIQKLEDKISNNNTKIKNFEKLIADEKSEIVKLHDKIIRINEAEKFPNAAVMFFLAEKFGFGEKAIDEPEMVSQEMITLADEFLEQKDLQEVFEEDEKVNLSNLSDTELMEYFVENSRSLIDELSYAEMKSRQLIGKNDSVSSIVEKLKYYKENPMFEGQRMKDFTLIIDTSAANKNGSELFIFEADTLLEAKQKLAELNFNFGNGEGCVYCATIGQRSSGTLNQYFQIERTDNGVSWYEDKSNEMPYIPASWRQIEDWSDINEFKNKQNVNINWNEKIGQQFTLRSDADGLKYTVLKVNDDKSVDFRRDDSWTFTAVNPVINSNGTIEWAYSKNGEFTDEKVLNEFLQKQNNSKIENTDKQVTEDTQFVMPPNFEYEEQPVTATPYTPRQSTGSQNNTETVSLKKETDELPTSDPNTKDEYNQLNPQNANSQETPLAVGKIEMSKKDFEEIKPKLQGLKENGSFISFPLDI